MSTRHLKRPNGSFRRDKMFSGDEAPKDWEIKDEEPPRRLQERWAKKEIFGQDPVICVSCKRPVPAESLSCLYCGEHVSPASFTGPGILKRLVLWLGDFISKGRKR